ncbi:DUF4252 domain-containing protein [Mariniphaga sp.]|uniref:DUF4252 domain-containing protein n=1 Tax=Mariniphaga sp. TaxID=1954475 RepID=UPI00356181D5
MKKILLIFTICVIPFAGWSQQKLFEELTEKYADQNGFSASQITSDMFDLYIKKRNIDEQSPVFDALKSLDNILVVSQTGVFRGGVSTAGETEPDELAAEIHQVILDYYKKQNFSLFKTEKQMGEDVKVFLKKNQEKIESLALVTHSQTATNLVELQGNIDLSNVSQLSQALNLRGLENLYKINNQGPSAFYVNSPKAEWSEERIEEMVARQRELAERQRFLSEEQRQKIEEQARIMADRQRELSEKHRELAEKYNRFPILLNYPGDAGTVYFLNGKKVDAEALKKIKPDDIESIEVTKPKKEGDETTIKIKTK